MTTAKKLNQSESVADFKKRIAAMMRGGKWSVRE
jgi:hypothetical protein